MLKHLKMEDLKELKYRSPDGEYSKWGHYLNNEQLNTDIDYDIIDSEFYLRYVMGYSWSLIKKDDNYQRIYMTLKEYQDPEGVAKEKKESKLRKEAEKELKNMTNVEKIKAINLYDKILKYYNGEIEAEDIKGIYKYNNVKVAEINKNIGKWEIQIDEFIYGCPPKTYEFERDKYLPSTLKRIGIINNNEYYKIIGEKPDQNEGREGYFQCWECGCWQPISKRQEDGTCGC